jgi:23S rRNA pseudouridine2605 synthase
VAERVRIQKALSSAGVMSRRLAEEAISQGRVSVDGVTAVLGDRVDVSTQALTLDGVPVPVNPALETHLLYKPVGVVSTARDPQGRKTVVDLVPSSQRLYPVGRLDVDSEGLILVTNDGDLANRVTHPSFGITKTYLVRVRGKVSDRTARRLVEGVVLDDGPASAVSAKVVDSNKDHSLVEPVMVEGRNREVRRMMAVVGHEAVALVRTGIGPLTDPGLQPGQSRLLTSREVRRVLMSGTAT